MSHPSTRQSVPRAAFTPQDDVWRNTDERTLARTELLNLTAVVRACSNTNPSNVMSVTSRASTTPGAAAKRMGSEPIGQR